QTGTAEQAGLAAADQRRQEVDDLDAGLKYLGLRRQFGERRRLAVDRPELAGTDRAAAIDRVAQQVEHPAECLLTDRHLDRGAGVGYLHAADEAVGRAQGHAADAVATEVLLHLAGEADANALVLGVDLERVVDFGQVSFLELGVEGRADDLN